VNNVRMLVLINGPSVRSSVRSFVGGGLVGVCGFLRLRTSRFCICREK
jgi:hypothetical protein